MDTKVKPNIENLRINGQRLWDSLMELAQIGATPKGGVCRIALTDADRAGRDQVVQWFRDAGLEVRIDEVGNVFGRRAGTDPQARAVATGSARPCANGVGVTPRCTRTNSGSAYISRSLARP